MSHDAPRLIVGMEVHLQLRTRTKAFSASPVQYGAEANTLVDPVVMGLPGALPVLNQEAVRLGMRTGLALGCTIATLTKWDRKNYFYPDLPKGYQISQFDKPLCFEGGVEIEGDDGLPKTIRIMRAHLEEDTGKSTHEASTGLSRVDLNRAGTPLLEIVTEPDIASADEAGRYLDALREIVRYLGTSDGNMQEGNLRCEPNINLVFPNGDRTPIVEVKNINSVSNVEAAIRFEVERQTKAYHERGETMANTPRSTRGWDDEKNITVHQRTKESADDYRYFPEPDLPPLEIPQAVIDAERAALPELPRARRARYTESYALSAYDAGVLTQDPALATFFEAILRAGDAPGDPKAATNWVTGELMRYMNEHDVGIEAVALTPTGLRELIDLQAAGTINARIAKELFREIVASGDSAKALVETRGLAQVSDEGAVEAAAAEAIAAQQAAADDFRAGNDKAIGRLIGATMKGLGGRGDPKVVRGVLIRLLRS